jgi:hypothetical protein
MLTDAAGPVAKGDVVYQVFWKLIQDLERLQAAQSK